MRMIGLSRTNLEQVDVKGRGRRSTSKLGHQNLGGMCEAGLGFGWSEAGVGDG